MEEPLQATNSKEDEISLKEVFLKLREWRIYLMKKWKIIVLFGILGAGIGFAYASMQKVEYIAQLTFVMEDSKSNALGGYAGLATQFGIDLGGSSNSGIFSGENLLEFMKSRLMVEKTLLSPVNFNGKEQSLAEFYISIYNLRKGWNTNPTLRNIQFPINPDRTKFSIKQDSILGTLYTKMITQHISVVKPDKKLSFVSVTCKSTSDLFSKLFTERLVKEAIDFYVQAKTKRSKSSVDKLQAKADSLVLLLDRKTYSMAASEDLNLNPARSVARVGTELVMRDKVVLQTMYAEVVKNLELSRMAMAQETPIIQIVDEPILPLKKIKQSRLIGLIVGGVVAGLLVLIWLIVRRMYKLIMSN